MLHKKPLIYYFSSLICAITLSAIPVALASSNSLGMHSPIDKGFVVAEAHQHGMNPDNKYMQNQQTGCSNRSKCGCGMMGNMKRRMKHIGHSYAHMISSHAEELELSDAQLGRIVRLHRKHSQEHKEFMKKNRKSMMQFHHESMKPSVDDATLRKLGNHHIETFKAMLEQHIRDRNVVHAILSSDQREQLKTMKMDHSKHGAHGGGKHNQR
jgi:Spy/CpxP family protein refolding chaperone